MFISQDKSLEMIQKLVDLEKVTLDREQGKSSSLSGLSESLKIIRKFSSQ
jgi:hypothetical protein